MRLIDADALGDKVADLYSEGEEATEGDKVVNDVIDLIDNAPTIDDLSEYSDKLWQKAYERGKAEGIKTGHRIWNEWQIFCSECREVCYEDVPKNRMNYPLNNFCPNCGAKMTKEVENE